eukprot:1997132-Lingulodinium_polyedra.AAC.1
MVSRAEKWARVWWCERPDRMREAARALRELREDAREGVQLEEPLQEQDLRKAVRDVKVSTGLGPDG